MRRLLQKTRTSSTGQRFDVEHHELRDTEIVLRVPDPADPSAAPLAERVFSIGAEAGPDAVLAADQATIQAQLEAAETAVVERAAARLKARALKQGLK